jgi:hypothetical protein
MQKIRTNFTIRTLFTITAINCQHGVNCSSLVLSTSMTAMSLLLPLSARKTLDSNKLTATVSVLCMISNMVLVLLSATARTRTYAKSEVNSDTATAEPVSLLDEVEDACDDDIVESSRLAITGTTTTCWPEDREHTIRRNSEQIVVMALVLCVLTVRAWRSNWLSALSCDELVRMGPTK